MASTTAALTQLLAKHRAELSARETGSVLQISHGVALVDGLPGVQAMELVEFEAGLFGLAFDLDPEQIGVVLLDAGAAIVAGSRVRRSGRVADVPVGTALLGRVVNALGQPLDEQGPLTTCERSPIEREAPAILERAPVTEPLQTGIKVIDAAIPIGRGQRQLIVGDRQTGKTAIALATLVNQRHSDVVCVYCAIGQRGDAVARAIETLRTEQIIRQTVVVVAAAEDPPGLQFITPYAATSIAEYFMRLGRDVVIVYDDLTHHALAYRELSLLLRRPPGREAYPGDIFHIHARLLERATRLAAGGSLTAMPIMEIEAENLAAYIATNLISITDGQIYLSPELFHKGLLPAVDVGKSVSRVGGKAQLPAYRLVAGVLKLYYAQFEELEMFARFGTRLDKSTRQILDRGQRVREILKQPERAALSPFEQILVLLAVTEGLFDAVPLHDVAQAELMLRAVATRQLAALGQRVQRGETLTGDDRAALLGAAQQALATREADGNRTNP
ncbi:F0F1 ATP synthase subunit alpha [Methylomonas sp. SURF-2]|uniref:ATP synthase subunit alpha n=2 Tax=Methylomonas subterranea TaxID=2952225 RepID=A0ABT1THM2_9GAMM|nr:F0F1 ATP synthase subunit alpha [Methylomonas sp. SURF-2]